MSKWSSVRSKILIAGLVIAAALAGCGRSPSDQQGSDSLSTTVTHPEFHVDSVSQEEPAVARQQWRAVNEAARNMTGNLRVSLEGQRGGPVMFAFANGVTIRAQPTDVLGADTRSGVNGQSFAAVLEADPRVNTHLYRVLDENVARSAVQGGLCGSSETKYLAVSEFVDSSSRWVFKLAAFRGSHPPGAASDDPGYCNSFAFAAQY